MHNKDIKINLFFDENAVNLESILYDILEEIIKEKFSCINN